MPEYVIEQDEVLRARRRTLSGQRPQMIPIEKPVSKKKGKKRGRKRSLSTRALKRVQKLERQGTKILKDVPPNVVGLRRKPRKPFGEKGLRDLGVIQDTRSNQEILNDFLS
jgi:hypothetical protein